LESEKCSDTTGYCAMPSIRKTEVRNLTRNTESNNFAWHGTNHTANLLTATDGLPARDLEAVPVVSLLLNPATASGLCKSPYLTFCWCPVVPSPPRAPLRFCRHLHPPPRSPQTTEAPELPRGKFGIQVAEKYPPGPPPWIFKSRSPSGWRAG
jgi:hypothetical protein